MVAEKPPRVLFAVLVVIVVVVAGVGAALLYEFSKAKSHPGILVVEMGDNVTVNYIGTFGSGAQEGKVFDTSIYSVATQNLSYPKSLEYQSRGPPSAYTPLGVHVGPRGSYTINNVTYGTVVTGFWQGLVGLPGNSTRTLVIPPNLAYGPLNSSCVTTGSLVDRVTAYSAIPASDFSTFFPNVTEAVGVVFTDPEFGWNDSVFSVNSTIVVIQSLATVGEPTRPDGLPFVVTSINSTTIVITSLLTPADAGLVLGHVPSGGLCGATKFIVSAVNLGAGTYTANYNTETTGETLDFTVTVVNILPP